MAWIACTDKWSSVLRKVTNGNLVANGPEQLLLSKHCMQLSVYKKSLTSNRPDRKFEIFSRETGEYYVSMELGLEQVLYVFNDMLLNQEHSVSAVHQSFRCTAEALHERHAFEINMRVDPVFFLHKGTRMFDAYAALPVTSSLITGRLQTLRKRMTERIREARNKWIYEIEPSLLRDAAKTCTASFFDGLKQFNWTMMKCIEQNSVRAIAETILNEPIDEADDAWDTALTRMGFNVGVSSVTAEREVFWKFHAHTEIKGIIL